MALWLKAIGGQPEYVTPANGRTFSLDEFYRYCSCECIQLVRTIGGSWMVLDESGKLAEKPINELATDLWGYRGIDPIVGDVLICEDHEIEK